MEPMGEAGDLVKKGGRATKIAAVAEIIKAAGTAPD
jgi:hypothetical protein